MSEKLDEDLLARGSWCSHGRRGCAWVVTVHQDGMVDVFNGDDYMKSGSYRLTPNKLAVFRAVMSQERPWEVQERIGTMYLHGPERRVVVVHEKVASCYHLYTTPSGLHSVYESSPEPLPRALRFCEALRHLAQDPDLPSCVDEK